MPLSASAQSVFDVLTAQEQTGGNYVRNVNSSAIRSITYHSSGRMTILFSHNNISYLYEGVPKELIARFMASHSKGTFYHRYIKNKFNIVGF